MLLNIKKYEGREVKTTFETNVSNPSYQMQCHQNAFRNPFILLHPFSPIGFFLSACRFQKNPRENNDRIRELRTLSKLPCLI